MNARFALLPVLLGLALAACQPAEAPVTGSADEPDTQQAAPVPETAETNDEPAALEEAAPVAEAAPMETAALDPGRTLCGPVSLVLPEGATADVTESEDGAVSTATITLPEDAVMEVHLVARADVAASYGEDDALVNQVQTWLDGIGPQMADEWTPEIVMLESPSVRGYYAVAKSELSGEPGKAFALNGFFVVDGNLVTMGALHDDESGATNDAVLEVIRTAEWAGS